jgi:hypothetical protein
VALRDFSSDKPSTKAFGGLLGLVEQLLCQVEVLRQPARDGRTSLAGAGAGEQQRCTEAVICLGSTLLMASSPTKTRRIEIRITDEERKLEQAAAAANGETLSEFVRRAGTAAPSPTHQPASSSKPSSTYTHTSPRQPSTWRRSA